jgi:hypothetical protein
MVFCLLAVSYKTNVMPNRLHLLKQLIVSKIIREVPKGRCTEPDNWLYGIDRLSAIERLSVFEHRS